uniref:Membrane-associated protein n=1 Tax=Pseudo-nitzschia australis TaxID=44445 RepID=A0A7S4EKH2_9STRA
MTVMMRSCWKICFVVIAAGTIGCCTNRNGWSATANVVKATIPSQILRARMPALESQQNELPHQNKNQQQQQLWLYEGALYDPLDGRQVASVQGLELVRPLNDTTHLAIDSVLRHPNATYVDAKTLWSQKIFCYTKTTTTTAVDGDDTGTTTGTATEEKSESREELLRSVRVRPQSPRKEVSLDQSVAVYETATTFISRTKNRRNNRYDGGETRRNEANVGSNDDEDELLVHSEWPNGQTIWGTTSQGGSKRHQTKNNPGSMDFTVFAKLRNKHSPLYAPTLIPDDEDDGENSRRRWSRKRQGAGEGDVIVSPKRAALIQFGSSDKTMESKHKYGARETYSYQNIAAADAAATSNSRRWSPLEFFAIHKKESMPATSSTAPSTSVHYTRYGEGPPFYAPGRMCMLELRGRPIGDLNEATPLLKGLLVDGGPVVNFNWKDDDGDEIIEESKKKGIGNRANRGRSEAIRRSTTITIPPSIQTAWNRKEKVNRCNADGSTTTRTRSDASPRRFSRTGRSSKYLLRLDVPEDSDWDAAASGSGPGRCLRVWTKRGIQRAETLWDRVKAATTMEAT